MCPYCRTNAPLVYRGLNAFCSGCGRQRNLLSGASLTYAGTPERMAGGVVRTLGWLVLVFGLGGAALVGLLCAWIFGATFGAAFGGTLALITLLVFWLSRRGGKSLASSAAATQNQRREQALLALAQNRGGRVQAFEAASVLEMSTEAADQLLTRLAKQHPSEIDVEVGDAGEIFYAFKQASALGAGAGVRIASGAAAPPAAAEPSPDAAALTADEGADFDARLKARRS